MMAALTEAGIAVTSAAAAENEDAAEECWTETIRAYERLIPLAAQRDLYAPVAGRRGYQRFSCGTWATIQPLDSHRPNPVERTSRYVYRRFGMRPISLVELSGLYELIQYRYAAPHGADIDE